MVDTDENVGQAPRVDLPAHLGDLGIGRDLHLDRFDGLDASHDVAFVVVHSAESRSGASIVSRSPSCTKSSPAGNQPAAE